MPAPKNPNLAPNEHSRSNSQSSNQQSYINLYGSKNQQQTMVDRIGQNQAVSHVYSNEDQVKLEKQKQELLLQQQETKRLLELQELQMKERQEQERIRLQNEKEEQIRLQK